MSSPGTGKAGKELEDPIVPLVRHVTSTRYDDLPPGVVEAAKLSILDCIAAGIAGSTAPGVAEVLGVLRHWGGRPESRVAFFGDRMPAHDAATINAVMSHALEIDDAHYPAIVHPTTPTLWSALAVADAQGPTSGKDLILSIVLGVDLMARLALAATRTLDLGYHTELYAVFGAAATAGKLKGLGESQLHHALGIAFPQAAAAVQAGIDGALVKRLQLGLNAANGIKAVALAQAGITGVSKVLDGKYGLYRLFNHSGCDRQVLLDGLGSRYLGAELSTKLYPSSRCAHAATEGTLDLAKRHDIRADDVEGVVVEVQDGCYKREQRPYDPSVGTPQAAAQFSIDYNVAAALLWREVFVRQMQDAATLDPRAIALASRVTIRRNEKEKGATPYLPVNIAIRMKDGTELTTTVTRLRGTPDDPLTWDEIVAERLGRCVEFSAVKLAPEALNELQDLVRGLERAADVLRILSLLTPDSRSVNP